MHRETAYLYGRGRRVRALQAKAGIFPLVAVATHELSLRAAFVLCLPASRRNSALCSRLTKLGCVPRCRTPTKVVVYSFARAAEWPLALARHAIVPATRLVPLLVPRGRSG